MEALPNNSIRLSVLYSTVTDVDMQLCNNRLNLVLSFLRSIMVV